MTLENKPGVCIRCGARLDIAENQSTPEQRQGKAFATRYCAGCVVQLPTHEPIIAIETVECFYCGKLSKYSTCSEECRKAHNKKMAQGNFANPEEMRQILNGGNYFQHPIKHYIAMSGSHGCLPDHCEVFETYADAVADLVQLFELGRTRAARLKKNSYLELVPSPIESRDEEFGWGAEYCEIQTCDCDEPAVHSDSQ